MVFIIFHTFAVNLAGQDRCCLRRKHVWTYLCVLAKLCPHFLHEMQTKTFQATLSLAWSPCDLHKPYTGSLLCSVSFSIVKLMRLTCGKSNSHTNTNFWPHYLPLTWHQKPWQGLFNMTPNSTVGARSNCMLLWTPAWHSARSWKTKIPLYPWYLNSYKN